MPRGPRAVIVKDTLRRRPGSVNDIAQFPVARVMAVLGSVPDDAVT